MTTPAARRDVVPRAEWCAEWVRENPTAPGLCRVCNAAAPAVRGDMLSCPTGCDVEAAYRRGGYRPLTIAAPAAGEPARATPAPYRPRTLRELMADPELTRPPRFVVPGMVEEGCVTLIAGAPKTGKSTLASQIAANKSRGRAALDGTEMAPGKVLWIALDEPARRLVQRLPQYDPHPDRFVVYERQTDTLTPTAFAALLEQESPALVVIDTLSQLGSDNGVRPNEADSVTPFMKSLVLAVQARPRCGGLFVFHAPHHAARAAGSVAWEATVDAPLVLRRPAERTPRPGESPDDTESDAGPDDGRRILQGVTRWGGAQRTVLSFRDGLYEIGTAEAPLTDRVRWYLKNTDPGVGRTSAASIAKKLGVRQASVTQIVREMLGRSEIDRVQDGGQSYLKPNVSMALYTTSAPEEGGRAGEVVREGVDGKSPPTPSRVHTPVPAHGKGWQEPDDDEPPPVLPDHFDHPEVPTSDGRSLELIAAEGPPPDDDDAIKYAA
jgi:broad-specificity NMP kinase